jgi:hypothetical protein
MLILADVLRVIHVLNAMLMIWPFYALVAVNQRGRLGPPLGDRVDAYLENMVKNRTVPCFVFQGTALVSGLALIRLRGLSFGELFSNPMLGLKFLLLLLIAGFLSYVHLRLQPSLDRLFLQSHAGMIPPETAARIQALRLHRKRLASLCLFSVLTAALLGVQVWLAFPLWLTLLLIAAIAGFVRRAYATLIPYGWV